MTRYLIKATYLSGPHTGEVYYLRKGGYVLATLCFVPIDDTYAYHGMCSARCCKMMEDAEIDYDIERRRYLNKDSYIFEHMKYEPYPVEYPAESNYLQK